MSASKDKELFVGKWGVYVSIYEGSVAEISFGKMKKVKSIQEGTYDSNIVEGYAVQDIHYDDGTWEKNIGGKVVVGFHENALFDSKSEAQHILFYAIFEQKDV
jgi:hypothetical protein